MAFLETPDFPACPSFGFVSQPDYNTQIVRLQSGREVRNRLWSRPLNRYTVTVGPRMEAEIYDLTEFWHAVGGQECGFRFKDWADYKSCAINATPAATDQPLVLITGLTYQLTKRYIRGARTQDRDIFKPISPVMIASGGTPLTVTTDYTVDYATGIVTLTGSQPGPLTWGGTFDVPVRFESEFPVEIIDKEVQSVSFTLMELRNP
jgi:uncharacterized protein (TIGR02217 family)